VKFRKRPRRSIPQRQSQTWFEASWSSLDTILVRRAHNTPTRRRFQDAGMNELSGFANQQQPINAVASARPISTPAVA
jgi:hypothetical protein